MRSLPEFKSCIFKVAAALILLTPNISVVAQMHVVQNEEATATERTLSKSLPVVMSGNAIKPKIAVSDLAFEQTVSEFFFMHDSKKETISKLGGDENEGVTEIAIQVKTYEKTVAKYETRIDRRGLRRFTSDIKGRLIESGSYRVTQAKPWVKNDASDIYDIIQRIKDGYFPGADYVLFGVINNIDFDRNENQIKGSSAKSYSLSLEIVVEFSLVNTKTFEIVAGFLAYGEGNDTRISSSRSDSPRLNKSKVILMASRSLGENVAEELQQQFPLNNLSMQ